MSLSVKIEKKIGSFLLKVQFEAENETIALLGASGCGKSMTLKCIAGIETPDRGRIVVDDRVLFDSEKKIDLSVQERHVGLMFQNYALFPDMTVLQNITAGAKREKDRKKREEMIRQVMSDFDLVKLGDHYPHQLSGGQQQRTALARMLVSDPQILLLDEPFSALDSHLRFRLEQRVREVIRAFGKTVVLVSHDRDEVYRMSDRIAVMDGGRIEVCGTKKEVFSSPKTKNGAILTGCKNLSFAEIVDDERVFAKDWGIVLNVGHTDRSFRYVGIRMHDITTAETENAVRCQVTEVIENPFSVTVMFRPLHVKNASPIGWETDPETWRKVCSEELTLGMPVRSILLLEDEDGEESGS